MSFSLQAEVERIEKPALPPNDVYGSFFEYPTPSSQHYCCRPSTSVYGTAPYMAGKGAPAEFIMVDDSLRPQSTSRFGKVFINTYERNVFPLQDVECSPVPLQASTSVPSSTRGDIQNMAFVQRYPDYK